MLKSIVNRCHRVACQFIDSPPRWPILIALLVFAAYFVGAQLSFILRVPSTRSSIIWAPNAVLLTALVATPPQTWWIWILAATPAHVIAQARDAAPVLLLLCPFVANVAQALLAAVVLRRLMDPPYRLETFRHMVAFILVAVLAAPAVASFTAAALFVAAGWENDYWVVATARMLNNMVTGLAVTPLCFALVDFERAWFHRFRLRRVGELTFILVALSLAASLSSIWQISEPLDRLLRLYAPLPFLVWVAVRFPPAGLAVGLLIVAYESIADSIAGHGVFTKGSAAANVLALETSLFAISLPLMLLAALMRERQRKEEALRESEARYRALVTASSDIVWRADPAGDVFSVTPAWCEVTGQTGEELCRFGWLEVVHPEDRGKYQRLWNQALAERHIYENELRVRTREGSYRHFYIHAVPILAVDGSVREWVGAATDITDRKRAESILRESEAVFRNMAEHAPVMIWISDGNGARTYVNKQWSDFTGIIGDAALGSRWLGSVHPEDRERARATLAEAHERHEKIRLEYHLRRHDGEYRWMIDSAVPRLDSSGEFLGFIGSILDITERKRAESRLQVQYRVTRVLSDSASLAGAAPALMQVICECLDWDVGELWQVGPDGSALTYFGGYSVSSNFAEFIASSRAFTFGSGVGLPGRVWQTGSAEWITRVADAARTPRAELAGKVGLESAFACPIKLGDRTQGVMAFLGRSIRKPDTELLQVMESIGRQIGQFVERKQAEAALRESEEGLRLAAEGSRLGIWHWNEVTQEAIWDAKTREMLGAPADGPISIDMFYAALHPDDRDRIRKIWRESLETGSPYQTEMRALRPDGSIRWIHSRGSGHYDHAGKPVRMIGVVFDITERKHSEEALRQALAEVQRLKERAEADNVYLREELSEAHRDGEIVGHSESLRNILRQVRQVAVTDMSVLIMGETGTGKELVARAIHEHSARRQRPLVKVNCSALPAELMESELFGHEKGAFTGAAAQRIGRFELADGGTIFLDEIGDLAPGLQTKLLRVLQEGEFERVGSSKTIRVNVRVIAATNRDLSEAMRKEAFRTDLYYRLAGYPIQMPPLRERKEDIALLAEAFLREASQRLGRSFEAIPRRVIEALERYEWPGNVRELQNAIERAAVTSPGAVLELPEVWHPEVKPSEGARRNNGSDFVPRAAGSTLALLERAHILEILKQTHWRIEGPRGAAVLLGLRPSTLRSRMRKLGIDRNTDGSPSLMN